MNRCPAARRPRHEAPRRVHRRFLAVAFVALAIALFTLARRPCSATLVPPDGHGSLPGGFEVRSASPTVDAQYVHGLKDVMLTPPNACPEGGLSLDDWFTYSAPSDPSYLRSPRELSLSADGVRGRFVVSGAPSSASSSAKRFVVAFRVATEARRVFLSPLCAMRSWRWSWPRWP